MAGVLGLASFDRHVQARSLPVGKAADDSRELVLAHWRSVDRNVPISVVVLVRV
jgi:hypothetical protein